MQDPDRPPELDKLDARLRAARRIRDEAERPKGLGIEQGSRYGVAWRLAVDMVAGLVVGAGMGWLLDKLFGTSPVLLVVFFFLGAGAGLRGAWRAAKEINAPEPGEPSPPRDGNGKTD